MENSEPKNFQPKPITSEKNPTIKQPGYFSTVNRVFNKLIRDIEEDAKNFPDDTTDHFDEVDFYREKMRDLQKLDRPNASKEIYPEEVAEALAVAFNTMAVYQNTNTEGLSESEMREYEKSFKDAKSAFMEGSGKMWPDIKANLTIENLSRLVRELHFEDERTNNSKELNRMLNERPKDLLNYLTKGIDNLGSTLVNEAKINYDLDDLEERDQRKLALSEQIELAYEMQLMRNKLQKQIYGSEYSSQEDISRINELENTLKNS